MKKLFTVMLVVALIALPMFAQGSKEAATTTAKSSVNLTMGSWRTDDVAQMNNLLNVYKEKTTNVNIAFQPTNPPDYNATLRLQLDSGTGPDLMYARSYAAGQELYNAGYFMDCSTLPGITDNFSSSNKAPWQMADGKMFAVPFAAVSHAVYYNKDVFKKEGLAIPQTWEEFLNVCATLKAKGYTPLANGLADEWDILECFFFGLLPNYIGGAESRVKYENKELPLNDENFVKAYQAMADVAKYCPSGFEAVTYNDSQVLFNTQRAAMFVDGSWTAGVYADATFDWGVFAIPAPQGRKTIICFHPDMAITGNKASKNQDEVKGFLTWLCTEEGATAASQNLPVGYFPMIKFNIKLDDVHANEFLALNAGKETDARFVWPALMNLYSPMDQAVIKVMKGEFTAKQAADSVYALYK